MKNLIYLILFVLVAVSCSRTTPVISSSNIQSVNLNSSFYALQSYAVDNSGKYLYVLGIDLQGERFLCDKIEIKTFSVVKSVVMSDKHYPSGVNNVVFNRNNQMIVTSHGFNFSEDLISVYDTDLNLISSLPYTGGTDRTRLRICLNNSDEILVAHNMQDYSTAEGGTLLKYSTLDMNLNVVKSILDTTLLKYDFMIGNSLFSTQDGSSIYLSRIYNKPPYNSDMLIEKRNSNFDLVWRSILEGPGEQWGTSIIEHNEKLYVYCNGTDPNQNYEEVLYVLIFDNQGNLLDKKDINNGGEQFKKGEPILKADDGGFLMTALTARNTTSLNTRGILFKCDANLNVINMELFGSKGAVNGSGMLKLESDRYLLLYVDNGFAPAESGARLVMRYIDGQGKFLIN